MEEMNQIIWALNPKNDNLEGLVTYIRRFAFEYLEPTAIKCHLDLPEEIAGKGTECGNAAEYLPGGQGSAAQCGEAFRGDKSLDFDWRLIDAWI